MFVELFHVPRHLSDPTVQAGFIRGLSILGSDLRNILARGHQQVCQIFGKVPALRRVGEPPAKSADGQAGGKSNPVMVFVNSAKPSDPLIAYPQATRNVRSCSSHPAEAPHTLFTKSFYLTLPRKRCGLIKSWFCTATRIEISRFLSRNSVNGALRLCGRAFRLWPLLLLQAPSRTIRVGARRTSSLRACASLCAGPTL